MKPSVCKECGCHRDACGNSTASYLDLHQQIAELHSQLGRSGVHIGSLEQQISDIRSTSEFELNRTKDELARLRERYERLLESHKKMQKLNHDLEEKLLRQVGQSESEKISLQQELSSMMQRLVDARTLISQLDEDNERYRQDCNVAVQVLQCKPSNFVTHRLNAFPPDLQERLRHLMPRDQLIAAENAVNKPEESKLVRIPIATFPPTAMVYSLHHSTPPTESKQSAAGQSDINSGLIPTSLIARALSQPRPSRHIPRIYFCSSCRKDFRHEDVGCQVDLLSRGARPVEITMYPTGSDRTQSPHSILSPKELRDYHNNRMDIKTQNHFVFSNGHSSIHHPHTGERVHREHYLSTSSTEGDY